MKTISYFLQSIIIYFFFIIGFILRLNLSRKLFSSLFLVIGPFFKSKKIINDNLKIFSKNVEDINEKKISREMWKNYGMTFIEYIFLYHFKKSKHHVEIIGEENLIEIKQNDPVIFVSGHFANFELMSMEITKKNIPLATIFRPLNNFFLNPFMEYLRKKYVCKNQIKKGINGVRDTINYIKKKYSIALMIDQRVSEGERIDFFGRPALTTTLPAQLSIRHNMKIIPVYIERIEGLKITKELNKILEKMIIKNPNQWIWSHDRWK